MERVLVLCTGNSARSQIAEALLRQKGGAQLDVVSAGVAPKGINPMAVRVMMEKGIDISHQRSKDVAEYNGQGFDWVITVCDNAKEKCPYFPGARTIHWNIQDPISLDDFRAVREELEQRITGWLSFHNMK